MKIKTFSLSCGDYIATTMSPESLSLLVERELRKRGCDSAQEEAAKVRKWAEGRHTPGQSKVFAAPKTPVVVTVHIREHLIDRQSR